MCGITALFSKEPLDYLPDLAQKMNQVITHRGPDASGLYCDEIKTQAVLAHQRLAIIDRSSKANQPFFSPDHRYVLIYNGEIFNYLELKEELLALGYQFHTNSDVEVVLNSYLAWKHNCLNKFNGMWGLVIYDTQEKEIFLSRDRFGIKPLYYLWQNGRLAIASEIKQLLILPWQKKQLNHEIFADWLFWNFSCHTENTFFKNIKQLPPASWAKIRLDKLDQPWKINIFWQPYTKANEISENQYIEELRTLFADAVKIRMRSDVPFGISLSGGLDSSSIICQAGKLCEQPILAFNVDFKTSGYSEYKFAKIAAKKAGAKLQCIIPNFNNLVQDWSKFIWHMEEPFDSLSFYANFLINRELHNLNIPVIFSGQGSDELFFGYPRYRSYMAHLQLRNYQLPCFINGFYQNWHNGNMSLKKQILYNIYFNTPYVRAIYCLTNVKPYLQPDFVNRISIDSLQNSVIFHNRQDIQDKERLHYQLPHLLCYDDRVSMANSIETRLPFLDHRLWELLYRIPDNLLFKNGWCKYPLRKAMSTILPDKICWRQDKMGFNTPTTKMLKQQESFFNQLLERHKKNKIFNISAIKQALTTNSSTNTMLIKAISFLAWQETFNVDID